jgi:hypothetical protein
VSAFLVIILPTAWSLLVYGAIRMLTGMPASWTASFWLRVAAGDAVVILVSLAAGNRAFAAGGAASAVIALALWWRNRPKGRRRAAEWLGAKSKACVKPSSARCGSCPFPARCSPREGGAR